MTTAKATRRLEHFLKRELGRTRRLLQQAGHRHADKTIHDTRKSIKKLRAALRLAHKMAEPALLDAVARPLREAAHRLAPLRDALVVSIIAADLSRRNDLLLPEKKLPPAAPLLRKARAEAKKSEDALRRLLKFPLNSEGLQKGLKRMVRRARVALKAASKSTNDENLHAWRRRVKDLAYSLELLDAPRQDIKALATLAELLGDDHDLAFFARHYHAVAQDQKSGLNRHLLKRRTRLQKKAFEVGNRALRHKPREIAKRVFRD